MARGCSNLTRCYRCAQGWAGVSATRPIVHVKEVYVEELDSSELILPTLAAPLPYFTPNFSIWHHELDLLLITCFNMYAILLALGLTDRRQPSYKSRSRFPPVLSGNSMPRSNWLISGKSLMLANRYVIFLENTHHKPPC